MREPDQQRPTSGRIALVEVVEHGQHGVGPLVRVGERRREAEPPAREDRVGHEVPTVELPGQRLPRREASPAELVVAAAILTSPSAISNAATSAVSTVANSLASSYRCAAVSSADVSAAVRAPAMSGANISDSGTTARAGAEVQRGVDRKFLAGVSERPGRAFVQADPPADVEVVVDHLAHEPVNEPVPVERACGLDQAGVVRGPSASATSSVSRPRTCATSSTVNLVAEDRGCAEHGSRVGREGFETRGGTPP